ncbi:MAG: hypothetical protein ACKOUM_09665 [Sphingopyxis sp.]
MRALMRPMRAPVAVLAGAALLGGCATAIPPVRVTRFHQLAGAAQPATGHFTLVNASANAADAAGSLEWGSYAAAVARQMERLGYTPLPRLGAGTGAATSTSTGSATGVPSYTVSVGVERSVRSAARRSPVSVGVGGSAGSYGSGLGVGVGVDLGSILSGGGGDVVATRLSVRVARRNAAGQPNADDAAATTLWEGRAETESGARTPAAQPGLAADKLAQALFRDFPGRSGETIVVP